jgi:hypothetical protein
MNGTITGMINDYTGHLTTTQLATTHADLFALQQQHAAQLGLTGNYSLINSNHQLIDDDDEDENGGAGLMNEDDDNDLLEKIEDDDDDQNHMIAGDIVDLQQIQLQQQYQQYGYATQDSLLSAAQDDNSGDYDNEYLLSPINSGYMLAEAAPKRGSSKSTTIATQTSHHHEQIGGKEHYRKIKPVKRPGLVLKTPIAYQGNIDPSVIPIQRDGMGKVFICFDYVFFLSSIQSVGF